jgi:hypothetical protein
MQNADYGGIMSATVILFDPTAPRYDAAKDEAQRRLGPVNLSGAVVGFIDNAKPNFNHLIDDLADLLTRVPAASLKNSVGNAYPSICQSSSCSPGTRENSSVLCVTKMRSWFLAIAAMSRSLAPIFMPIVSSSTLIMP